MVTEMIHTATLVHDDIIDGANVRRGKPSVNKIWREKKVQQHFTLAHVGNVFRLS